MKLLIFAIFLLFAGSPILLYDYIIFTQVWPGSYIQEGNITGTNFTNNYFVIHGLWPNYYNGSYPTYCQPNATLNVTALAPILTNLTEFWTDFVNPEQFWAHEWTKHGTCVGNNTLLDSEISYFTEGLEQRNRFDLYEIFCSCGIYPSNTKCYNTKFMQDCVDQHVGFATVLICDSDDTLEEVQICLDKGLKPFSCPANLYKYGCKSSSIVYNMVLA